MLCLGLTLRNLHAHLARSHGFRFATRMGTSGVRLCRRQWKPDEMPKAIDSRGREAFLIEVGLDASCAVPEGCAQGRPATKLRLEV